MHSFHGIETPEKYKDILKGMKNIQNGQPFRDISTIPSTNGRKEKNECRKEESKLFCAHYSLLTLNPPKINLCYSPFNFIQFPNPYECARTCYFSTFFYIFFCWQGRLFFILQDTHIFFFISPSLSRMREQ